MNSLKVFLLAAAFTVLLSEKSLVATNETIINPLYKPSNESKSILNSTIEQILPGDFISPFSALHQAIRDARDNSNRSSGIRENLCNMTSQGCKDTEHLRDKARRMQQVTGMILELRNPNFAKQIPKDFSKTFYPSCKPPQNVDAEIWNSDEFFHLFFNVTETERENNDLGSNLTKPNNNEQKEPMVNAYLKIFKKGKDFRASTYLNEPSSACRRKNEVSQAQVSLFQGGYNPSSSSLPSPSPSSNPLEVKTDEKIRITVFSYSQHLTPNHFKRKLLESRSFYISDTQWIEFDITRAVRFWIKNKNNNGLLIEIDNENEIILNATDYIMNMNCSIPKNESSQSQFFTPTVEICYSQSQPDEIRNSIQLTINGQNKKGPTMNPLNANVNEEKKHRIRHGDKSHYHQRNKRKHDQQQSNQKLNEQKNFPQLDVEKSRHILINNQSESQFFERLATQEEFGKSLLEILQLNSLLTSGSNDKQLKINVTDEMANNSSRNRNENIQKILIDGNLRNVVPHQL